MTCIQLCLAELRVLNNSIYQYTGSELIILPASTWKPCLGGADESEYVRVCAPSSMYGLIFSVRPRPGIMWSCPPLWLLECSNTAARVLDSQGLGDRF